MRKILRWLLLAFFLLAVPSLHAQNGALNNINYSAILPPNCSATGTFGYPRVWYLITNWNGYTAGFYWCNSAGQWVNGGGSGSGPTLQTNGTNNTLQSLVNFKNSSTDAVGLHITMTSDALGNEVAEITGTTYAGNAATATQLSGTPSLCNTGFAPTGILANGNATGCAALGSAMVYPAAGIAVSTGSAWGSPATSSTIIGLFTGCVGTDYLGADGACHSGGGSMVYPAGTGIPQVVSGASWGTTLGKQGTDSNVLTSGTVSGTGTSLCTDANGGATTSGCPTASAPPATGTSAILAGPAGARYTSVGIEGSPTPCQWYRAGQIVPCKANMTLNVGDRVFVAIFNQATTCNISDTYSNTWTLDANLDTNNDRLWESVITTGGSADKIIPDSGCVAGTGYVPTMVVFRTAGDAGVDNTANIASFGNDTCGTYSNQCSSTVTTASAGDAVIFVSAIQAAGSGTFIGQGVNLNPPMNIVAMNQDEDNGPVLAITGEQYSGNYTFTYNTGSAATGGGGGAFGFLIPMKSAPTIYGSHASTQIVPSTNPSLSITISIGQNWLAGGMTNGIDWTVAGCGNASLVDSLGNVWTPHLSIEGDTHGIIWTMTASAAGSDTISPPSACGLASSIRGGLFYATQITGNFAIDTFHEADDTTLTSDVRNPYDYVIAAETDWNTGGSTFRLSSPLTQIEAQNTPTATYPGTVEAGLFPTAQQYSVTSILHGIVQIVTFLGSGQPSLPTASRKLNPYDMSVPQLQAAQVVTPIPATACNGGPCLLYRGDLTNSFQVTLTENIGSSDYGSFIDGAVYHFHICEDGIGGWLPAWTSNGIVTTVNPPVIDTRANACTDAFGQWVASAQKLYFLTPPSTASGQIVIATATSGSHTFTTSFATAPTCTAALDGTTPPATALSYAVSATTAAVKVTLSASGTATFDVHCTSVVGKW